MYNRFNQILNFLVLLAIIDFCFPRNAYAYLDPGTGSYLFQMLLAALLGGLFALKIFWRRIVDFFRKLFKN